MHRTNSEKTRAQYQTDYALFHRYQREEIEHLSLTGSLCAGDPEWFRLQPQIDIAGQYFVSICYAFDELVECYGWAVAAERVARQLETQAKKDYAGYWRYTVRNYHLRNFLAGHFALQDHVAFMINELSKYELVPADKDGHPRRVDFPKVKSALESRRQGAKGEAHVCPG